MYLLLLIRVSESNRGMLPDVNLSAGASMMSSNKSEISFRGSGLQMSDGHHIAI